MVERALEPGVLLLQTEGTVTEQVPTPEDATVMSWRGTQGALKAAQMVFADDWRLAAINWLKRREAKFNAKTAGVAAEDTL